MELTILGSGTAVPSLRRGAPGYLLRLGGDRIVLDAGPGTLARLLAAGVRHEEVTHILCTHNHLDHSGEIPSWLFTNRVPGAVRTTPLTIAGSRGFMTMLAALRDLHGHWLDADSYALTLLTLGGARDASIPFGGWDLTALPMSHIESSIGFRIIGADGATFAYTGDTDVCDDAVALARDADLLLIEASTPHAMKIPGHLTPPEAGEIARRARARRVVLTHFYPACDGADMLSELRRTYSGDALLAEDGMRITI